MATIHNRLRKLLRLARRRAYWSALIRFGVAAAVEHEKVLRTRHYQAIVDVGANRGQFALAVRTCFPDARIYCFEPLTGPFATLNKVFAQDTRFKSYQFAVGPHRALSTMHLSSREDSSSLLPIGAQSAIFDGTDEVGTTTVMVSRLDEVLVEPLERPAILKLDVQGYELQALQGCEGLLQTFTSVYVECSYIELYTGQALAPEVTAWLNQRGFSLTGIHNPVLRKGQVVQADLMFDAC